MLSAASALPAMAAPIMAAAPAELGAARSPYANFLIGRYAIANGDVTTAAEAMNAAAAADPSSPDLRESAFLIGILNGDIERAAQEQEAIARARDLRFALDRILVQDGGAFGDRIDPRRIVAAGHSYGANTTLIAAGARVIRDGRPLQARDPRIAAGIVISAPPFYGERDLRAVLGAVEIPTLHVTATEDVIQLPGRTSPFSDRLAVYEAIDDFESLADSMALMAEWISIGGRRAREASPEIDFTAPEARIFSEQFAQEHREMAAEMYAMLHELRGEDQP